MQNSSEFQYIAIDTIHESATNPRRTFDECKLGEPAESIAANEPHLTSALDRIAATIAQTGLTTEKIIVAGFSQGACLLTEFVASHPARYAGLIAFTGGLVGPLGSDVTHTGDLQGTPALLLSGDPDPHVPWSRVEESAAALKSMGAEVRLKRYPRLEHTVSADEIELARQLVAQALPEDKT